MKVLFVSNLYPDASRPQYGLHNARVVRHIAENCELRVLAPRPSLALRRRQEIVPCPEDVAFHPRYPRVLYVPKIGSAVNHLLFARGAAAAFQSVADEFSPDVVLSAWLYPDACAAVRLARQHGLPAVQIAQGTDVHRYLRNPLRRRAVLQSVRDARCTVARSQYLADRLIQAGAPAGTVRVIYNGVDRDVFRPGNKCEARKHLGLPEASTVVLFVGHLYPVKNPLLALCAVLKAMDMAQAERDWRLVFVGEGGLRGDLVAYAEKEGLGDTVRFAGERPPAEVAAYMQAADVLCVSSNDEGLPNVIREGFASGLPVAATRVGGISEIVTEPFLGELVFARDADAMARALSRVVSRRTDVDAIRDHSRRFSWDEMRQQYFSVLNEAIQYQRTH